MPEATGLVIIKLSEEGRVPFLGTDSRKINIATLSSEAGIKPFAGQFMTEGQAKVVSNYIVLSPFGQEWMAPLEEIAKNGSGVELYGVMQDEYGFEQVYILSALNKRLCTGRDVDFEEDDEPQKATKSNAKIEKFFPKEVQLLFPKKEKCSIIFYISEHLKEDARKKNLPIVLEHEGFQYKLTRRGHYCSIVRENCDGSEEGNIDWAFECISQAKEEFENTYGLPVDLWKKAKPAS